MSILQPFKMAWRSIVGKKGRSTLTILSIFIGIAAVMTIVSVMEGMKLQVMKQFTAFKYCNSILDRIRYALRHGRNCRNCFWNVRQYYIKPIDVSDNNSPNVISKSISSHWLR